MRQGGIIEHTHFVYLYTIFATHGMKGSFIINLFELTRNNYYCF